MSKGSLYIVLFLLIASCDDMEDYYEGQNSQPVLSIYNQKGIISKDISDSIKVGFSMEYQYSIKDEENLSLEFMGSTHVSIEVEKDKINVKGKEKGFSENSFFVSDIYGQQDESNLFLTIFDNLSPIAVLEHNIVRLDDSYVLELYGSQSYDRDASQGGKILEYEYTVGSYSKITTEKVFRYSINGNATYIVKFRVKDNDGSWSDEIVKIVYS